jgi:CHAT domain-containing protein
MRSAGLADDIALHGLSTMLLADLPAAAEDLIIVADGPLHRLPWSFLRDPRDGQPVGIARRVTHAASASAWLLARDRPVSASSNDLLLVGDPSYTTEQFPGVGTPRLPGTARELDEIGCLAPTPPTILTGENATEAAVMRELPRHNSAHIACHGVIDPDDSQYSGLILSPPLETDVGHDDILQAWEIAEMRLANETVILSSCSAAAGALVKSEGLVGVVDALQRAGVRQVAAPLWPIFDSVVPDIVTATYRHLAQGFTLDEAMRLTRCDFRNANPRHWACWSVYGPPPQR